MLTVHVANSMVTLPAPEKIPLPGSRDAFGRVIAIAAESNKAWAARDRASAELRQVKEEEPRRLGIAMAAGADPGESPIPAAQATAAETQTHLGAVLQAENFILQSLREAVLADRGPWSATVLSDAQKGLTKLVTAVRMAEDAATTLHDCAGLSNMFEELDAGGSLTMRQKIGASYFEIAEGVAALQNGLGQAAHEVETLKTAAKAAAKAAKAPKPVEAVVEPAEVAE